MILKSSHCAQIIIFFPLSGTQRAATSATCHPPTPSPGDRCAAGMGGGTASSSCPTSPNPPQPNVRHVPRCGCTAVAQASLTCRPNVNLQLEAGSVHHVWGRRSCRGAQSREKWLRESRTAAWNPLHCAAEGGAQSRDPPWHGLNAQLQQPHRGHTAGGGCRGWGWGLCGDRRWPWWLCAPWGRAQWVCMAGGGEGRVNQSSLGETMGASAIIALVKVPAQYEKLIFTCMFLKEFHLLFSSLLLFFVVELKDRREHYSQ